MKTLKFRVGNKKTIVESRFKSNKIHRLYEPKTGHERNHLSISLQTHIKYVCVFISP